MKFAYFGSSGFSRSVLEGLCCGGFVPAFIISKPDKPKGRGLRFLPTEVSLFAESKNIPCAKPSSLRGENSGELFDEEADFFIVVDYGEIIPASLLSIPKRFSLCVHPSLLPLYRGAAPIEYALINGEKNTGVTIFKVNERVDAGDVILQKKVAITDNDDFFSLSQKLAKDGVQLLIEAIGDIHNNNYVLTPQDEAQATLTHKLSKEDGRIRWGTPALRIRNLIRATLDWPSAYTYYNKLMIKILDAEVIEGAESGEAGTIIEVSKEGIRVGTSEGILKIRRLRPQGKDEMDAWSFVCGYRVGAGDKFS